MLDKERITAKDAVAQYAGGRLTITIEGRACLNSQSESLPVGILDEAEPDVFRFTLRENDWIIMMSGGVADILGDQVKQAVVRHATGKPEEAALRLVELAKKIIGKYIFIYQATCVNRKAIYYSVSFEYVLSILIELWHGFCPEMVTESTSGIS